MNNNQIKTQTVKNFSIHHELIINASLTKVFKFITEPEHLINWWPKKCIGIPKIGEEYNFFFTPEYDWFGQVIECSDNRKFHIKMTKADTDWATTTFGFNIEDYNDNVLLKFWHAGWLECNSHYRKSSFCWAMLLNGLKNYIEKGSVIPFDKRA